MGHYICLDCNAVHVCQEEATHPVFAPTIAELPPTPGNVFTFPSPIVDQELPHE
jgi:hypothetical protein